MKEAYQPTILVDTEGLSREDWLDYRRQGIGGSDAAAVLGISPWRTARDLYYDKLGVVSVFDEDSSWVQLEVGHLLEPLVARIFEKKTGFKVYQRKSMFQHPAYPWMLADLDYLVELPDGGTAILEIKTCNYNAKDNWWYNGKEIVPIYYESQARHYMCVMNIDRVYFCCLYKRAWFRIACPNGRMILRPLRITEELAIIEAQVYLSKDDPQPLSSVISQVDRAEAKNGKYIEAAQDKALNEALDNAGFGIQLCDIVEDPGRTQYGSELPVEQVEAAQDEATDTDPRQIAYRSWTS